MICCETFTLKDMMRGAMRNPFCFSSFILWNWKNKPDVISDSDGGFVNTTDSTLGSFYSPIVTNICYRGLPGDGQELLDADSHYCIDQISCHRQNCFFASSWVFFLWKSMFSQWCGICYSAVLFNTASGTIKWVWHRTHTKWTHEDAFTAQSITEIS